jgi:hypothetical protein
MSARGIHCIIDSWCIIHVRVRELMRLPIRAHVHMYVGKGRVSMRVHVRVRGYRGLGFR